MIYDVIIIGSGPSGLTAGIYTSRASLKTLLFAGKKWGGQLQLTTEVENFPGFPDGIMGPELMQNMRKQAEKFGVEIVDAEVTAVDFSKRPFTVFSGEHASQGDATPYVAKSIIVATGADTMWLNIPGEQKFIGKGVSSCAPCDAFFYRNKHVIVVGGGDSAMEEAMVLTKFASRVTVVHRRDSFRASNIMVDRVMNHEKIDVIWNTSVEEIKGEQKVNGVVLRSANSKQQIANSEQSIIQKYNGFTVSEDTKNIVWEMPVDGVFVAIGHRPNNAIFKGIVDMDEKGYIVRKDANSKRQTANSEGDKYGSSTNVHGIFVSGDNHDHIYKQAITAAGYGCQAAMDVERWLEEQSH